MVGFLDLRMYVYEDNNSSHRRYLPILQNKICRNERVRVLNERVYRTQNHRVSGLCQSSDILKTIKHKISGTQSVSVLR
jgi:hypothetical protein